jgi:vacuolar-type H+-ATPase subunit I/STV1
MNEREILKKELESIAAMCSEIDGNIDILRAQQQRICIVAEAIAKSLEATPEQLEFELVVD